MGLLGWHRSWRAANGTSLILHEANDSCFSLEAGDQAASDQQSVTGLAMSGLLDVVK